jgi:hypothetical protein
MIHNKVHGAYEQNWYYSHDVSFKEDVNKICSITILLPLLATFSSTYSQVRTSQEAHSVSIN